MDGRPRSPDEPQHEAEALTVLAQPVPVSLMTSDQSAGIVRSGERGEFGDLVPVRPGAGRTAVCLRDHRLDLDLDDKLAPYSHRYKLHGTLCEVCRAQEGLDPSEHRLAEWVHLDVAAQYTPEMAPGAGLVVVVHQPPAGTLSGRIELRLDGREVATATASICGSCRTATLDYVHVTAEHRRLGYGRTLVAAAVARAPGYRWTAPLPRGLVASSFRARIAMRRAGPPCAHSGGDDVGR
ncbi:GNAT family N-acetyltransferase [Amycolatopsis sp. RTGN1]|uniref:GNAT family N-acetyltransferase n=1 Tax=Amycolatopsis ponsaeliensis TaxID=2992142 RepID=UPI00254EE845|nr:GNAT family N-acetyltransferase [Amycolatopsis sp. RTGN1]